MHCQTRNAFIRIHGQPKIAVHKSSRKTPLSGLSIGPQGLNSSVPEYSELSPTGKAPGCTVALSDPSACREKNTGKSILSILPPGANVSILVVGVGIHVDNF
ncbi:hypothetical protein RRG08_034522 [Elysia crispata]|uniref:Uncharacterized protein n=1 Tax=Elysia crispata TaxID=231223 RepID=A0AAE1BBV8_9GAST|nr:hypothetical protein RRG08_034522 [Elysia crispata]